MTAKQYLSNLRKLGVMIRQKKQELSELKDMSTAIGSFDYTKDRVQTSVPPDARHAEIMNRMVDLNNEIHQEIDDFSEQKHKIINQIHALSNRIHIDLLFKKYVEFKTLEECAVELSISYRQVIRIHGHALQEFEKCHLNVT